MYVSLIMFLVLVALVAAILLPIIPANIARDKGSDHYGLWWFCGFLMFPITLIVALAMHKESIQQTPVLISTADELQKFKKLLDEGVITQREFDMKKYSLLNNTPVLSANSDAKALQESILFF